MAIRSCRLMKLRLQQLTRRPTRSALRSPTGSGRIRIVENPSRDSAKSASTPIFLAATMDHICSCLVLHRHHAPATPEGRDLARHSGRHSTFRSRGRRRQDARVRRHGDGEQADGAVPQANGAGTEPSPTAVERCLLRSVSQRQRAGSREDGFQERKPRAAVCPDCWGLGCSGSGAQLVQENRYAT